MKEFQINSSYKPAGDQPEAIAELISRINAGEKYSTLLGVTGSGKTFTVANVIKELKKPVLVMSHNKTLAAQLFGEFSGFFPTNAVEFFISYYDYYQPEAYIPSSDTYIEKDADINEDIDRLRLRATTHLMDRRDVVIVASVSSIFGLGNPKDYAFLMVGAEIGERTSIHAFSRRLVDIHYTRNEFDLARGTFRVRGDVMEILPAYEREIIRIEFFGDEIDRIITADPMTGEIREELEKVSIYPAKHFVTTNTKMKEAVKSIRAELADRLDELNSMGKLLEAQRLEQRTMFDIEMMLEVGYVSGIENYSRHLADREPGSRPWCLLDYFPKDFLVVIDESHVTVPQIRAMFNGDRSRKQTLVEYGFRLPSALDNRPLKFEEFLELAPQILFVSATPSAWDIEMSGGKVVEQVVRPTGLIDPEIEVRGTKGQVEDLLSELRKVTAKGERALVTTLTKRMAEDLAEYLSDFGLNVQYLHSEIDALERVDIIRDLRLGNFEVLIGVNLLREGLDLPEVTLVAIMDADKEGFLRSETSLVQTAGRAARNVSGKVLLYADRITNSMARAMEETERRRLKQIEFNEKHGITPTTIMKSVDDVMASTGIADARKKEEAPQPEKPDYLESLPIEAKIDELERMMNRAAANMEFEQAAFFRDEIRELEKALPPSRKKERGKSRPKNPGRKITRFY